MASTSPTLRSLSPVSHHIQMKCIDHPDRNVEFWDPVRQCVCCPLCYCPPRGRSLGHAALSLDAAMQQFTPCLQQLCGENKRRREDLAALESAVQEALVVCNMRAKDAEEQVKLETHRNVEELHRREEELLQLIRQDTAVQVSGLQSLIASLQQSREALAQCSETLLDTTELKERRLTAISTNESVTNSTGYIRVPRAVKYTVRSRVVEAAEFLTVARNSFMLTVPRALTATVPGQDIALPAVNGTRSTGVFFYLGTSEVKPPVEQSGAEDELAPTTLWVNPASSGVVGIHCSTMPLLSGSLCDLVTPLKAALPAGFESLESSSDDKLAPVRTKSQPGTQIVFDLGRDRRLLVTSYMLQHGHVDEHAALRNWSLRGSNDGRIWSVIDDRTGDAMLTGPFVAALFHVQASDSADGSPSKGGRRSKAELERNAYRFLALEVTGPDAALMHHIELLRIEFFGTLLCTEAPTRQPHE